MKALTLVALGGFMAVAPCFAQVAYTFGYNSPPATPCQANTGYIDISAPALYGIYSCHGGAWVLRQPDWSQIAGKSAVVVSTNTYADPSWITTLDWSKIINKPSTFPLTVNGQTLFGGTAPTVSACGTSPTMATGATNNAGTINVGSGLAVLSCTLTFSAAFANPPSCQATSGTVGLSLGITSVSGSAVTFGISLNLGAGKLYYQCF